jgi:hypothetical protein
MQTRELHQAEAPLLTPAKTRRSRSLIVLGAGILSFVLAAIGVAAALAGESTSAAQKSSAAVAEPKQIAAAPEQSPEGQPLAPVVADGIYPTYIRKVDVPGAQVTLDVIQVFENDEAAAAAIEDGAPPGEAEYLYIYIRNQNPRLRTLPVASDVRITFADGCEAPRKRDAALSELRKKTMPFNDLYFYDVTVKDGAAGPSRSAPHPISG